MGLYDRDYFRDEQPAGFSLATQPMVIKILLVTIALYVLNMFTYTADPRSASVGGVFDWLGLELNQSWQIWRFVTYGLAHDPDNLMHIAGNMFMLWMFGRIVEGVLGQKEFLRFYLLAIVAGGVAWGIVEAIADKAAGDPVQAMMIGASAGVAGVVILFALKFPREEVRLMFLFPIKAWIFGVIFVASDAIGLMGSHTSNEGPQVAFMAHLGGAAVALAYVKLGWNLGRVPPFSWIGSGVAMPKLRRKSKLRIHEPDEPVEPAAMGDEVDRILEKISQQGEGSLTAEERRTLSDASKRYQRRRS